VKIELIVSLEFNLWIKKNAILILSCLPQADQHQTTSTWLRKCKKNWKVGKAHYSLTWVSPNQGLHGNNPLVPNEHRTSTKGNLQRNGRHHEKIGVSTRVTDMCFLETRTISKNKSTQDLGFKHVKEANESLFLKIDWRIINNRIALWVQLVKAKYLTRESFTNSTSKPQCSALWREVQSVNNILLNNTIWSVVDGKSIRIFEDRWAKGLQWPIPRPVSAPQ